eukprot:scaffold6998_cov57-Attheya_sp.AAC.2
MGLGLGTWLLESRLASVIQFSHLGPESVPCQIWDYWYVVEVEVEWSLQDPKCVSKRFIRIRVYYFGPESTDARLFCLDVIGMCYGKY